MSGKLMLQAILTARAEEGRDDRALARSSRLLALLMLADAANKAGICWPSQPALARMTRLSVRTISDALDDLERDGHITIKRRPGRNDVFTVHPGNHCRSTPAIIAGVGSPLQPLQAPRQPLPDTPATAADEPSKEPKTKNQRARPCALEAERALQEEDCISPEEFARMMKDPAAYLREIGE